MQWLFVKVDREGQTRGKVVKIERMDRKGFKRGKGKEEEKKGGGEKKKKEEKSSSRKQKHFICQGKKTRQRQLKPLTISFIQRKTKQTKDASRFYVQSRTAA